MAIASSSWLTIGPPLHSGYERSIPLPVTCKETVKVLLKIWQPPECVEGVFSEVRIAPVQCGMDCVCGWGYRGYPSKY